MAISKIILNGVTQMDLTQDTVEASNLLSSYTAHKADGTQVTGTATSGVDIPVFTLIYNQQQDSYSATCNKTFSECKNSLSDIYGAILDFEGDTYSLSCIGDDNSQIWFALFMGDEIEYDIIYHSNGTINVSYPSSLELTLNATQNGTYTPQSLGMYTTVNVNVPSGSSMNVQVAQSTTRATSSTYTEVISLTCSTAGKYDIYWDCFRSSTGGTSGSQLYIGGTEHGSANTSFTNHIQNNHLTNVTLTANQTVSVYARSRGSNYYAYVGTLVIKQTA